VTEQKAAILALFERHGLRPQQPAEWAPAAADWQRLAISLAIAAREPGFTFDYQKPDDLVSEADVIRDRYVREQRRRSGTLKRASREAARRLNRDIRDGQWAHLPKLKPIGAPSIETGFSSRDARAKRDSEADRMLGTTNYRTELMDRYLSFRAWSESLVAAAQRMTMRDPDPE
jgi:hypothetical protein